MAGVLCCFFYRPQSTASYQQATVGHMVMKLTEKFRWLECFRDDWAAEVILRTRIKNAIAEHQRREKRLEAEVEAEVIYTAPGSDDVVEVDEGTAPERNKRLEVC